MLNFPLFTPVRCDAHRQVWIDTTTDDTNAWTADELRYANRAALSGSVLLTVSGYNSAIIRPYAKAAAGSFVFEIAAWPPDGVVKGYTDGLDYTVAPNGVSLAVVTANFGTGTVSRHPVLGTASDTWLPAYSCVDAVALGTNRVDGTGLTGTSRGVFHIDDLLDSSVLAVHVYSFTTITQAMLAISLRR
jgi:hypothetical protein